VLRQLKLAGASARCDALRLKLLADSRANTGAEQDKADREAGVTPNQRESW
jgi:hypothetical protein